MSAAVSMTTRRRLQTYGQQNATAGAVMRRRGDTLTPRQYRRAFRKALAMHGRLIREGFLR